MSNIAMTFRASIEYDKARPPLKATDPANLASVHHVLSDEDSARLTGDLLRNAAYGRRALEVWHIEGFRDHAEWMARWYTESDSTPCRWYITLPLVLHFERGEPMHGGLRIAFDNAKGKRPTYAGISTHT